jgi:hypothetical protein
LTAPRTTRPVDTAHDTHERLDYARMAQVVQGVWAVVQGF